MANASTWEGRPSMMSINRLMTASTTPPLNAAPTPASIPTADVMRKTVTAAPNDVVPPTRERASRSRPA